VLYRGCVAEIGDVEKVIKEPKHPHMKLRHLLQKYSFFLIKLAPVQASGDAYTKLMVESIPQPDPEKRWGPNPVAFADHGSNEKNRGCKFAVACPFVIPDLCQIPPLLCIASIATVPSAVFSTGMPPKFRARKCFCRGQRQ
jgi:peptide/nickel transport system ATP-binding protein